MKGKKILSYALAASMSLSLFAGMAFTASAETLDNSSDENAEQTISDETLQELLDNFNSGINEDGSTDDSVYDYKEGSEAESLAALSDSSSYPETYDLRNVNGKSYVTPVKFQNPWGTCWAFGIIAASESSILYELDQAGEGIDSTEFDLAEHHLAWFAKNHISSTGECGYVNNQDGEGTYYTNEKGEEALYNESMSGGTPFYGTSVFATGAGVALESDFLYRGANGAVIAKRNADADEKYEEDTREFDSVEDYKNADKDIRDNYTLWCYSKNDDWSLSEADRFTQKYALEESNVLPSVTPVVDSETGEVTLNEDGINAVKSELMEGKGVEMAFCADSSNPNADYDSNTARYINKNWAHYCWDSRQANHSVCIVGWDDSYSADNFGQDTPVKWDANGNPIYQLNDGSEQELSYDTDGTLYYIDKDGKRVEPDEDKIELAREKDSSVTKPAGDGAWIVKNSWGSSDNTFPNKNTWGVDGSGYFYLSYYDTSVSMLETFDFAVTDEEIEDYDYGYIEQYDYLTASATSQSTAYSPVMMANVFTAEADMEINAISCETTIPGTNVLFGLVLMDDDNDYPTSKDEFECLESDYYTYGGYHRHELSNPVVVSEGQKYAIIAIEESEVDGQTVYSICSNTSYSKELADVYGVNSYNVGVINPGESYLCTLAYNTNDEYIIWNDYYNFISQYQAMDKQGKYNVYDNFSLKAYGTPTTQAAPVLDSAANTKTGVKVSWESKGTGYDYRLFMRESGTTKWNVVADTESTSYIVTGLTAGTSYDFTVCCMEDNGMDYLTPYDKNGVSCTYLPYVKTTAKAASSGIKLSWTKSAGASGYNIYRKSETSDYEIIDTIYNNAKVTYQDTTAKQGVVYTYKVKAFGNVSESASNTVSKVILKTPTLKVSSTKSKTVTVKWSKNTKATGYQIKYRVGSKIKVVKVKNAATVKKVLKKLKKGKICKVKVRSYKTVSGKTYFSNWSKLKKVKIK